MVHQQATPTIRPVGVMNALRAVGASRTLRGLALRPSVRRIAARTLATRFLLAAGATTTPIRLVGNELFHRGSRGHYTVRATGQPVVMVHGRDLEALHEVFHSATYEPPADLAARLPAAPVVLDVGANVGMFSAWAAGRWPGCSIVAFEPAHENIPLYRDWLDASRAGGRGLDATLIEACATPFDGWVAFVEGRGAGSFQTGTEAATRAGSGDPAGPTAGDYPAVDLFPYLARADLAKLDIEGGEWAILADPRLADLTDLVVVLEYHRHLAPSLPAAQAARDLLEAAGFTVGHEQANFWGHGTLWAWKA